VAVYGLGTGDLAPTTSLGCAVGSAGSAGAAPAAPKRPGRRPPHGAQGGAPGVVEARPHCPAADIAAAAMITDHVARVPSTFRQRLETGTRWRKVPEGVDTGQQGCRRIRAGGDPCPLTSSATDRPPVATLCDLPDTPATGRATPSPGTATARPSGGRPAAAGGAGVSAAIERVTILYMTTLPLGEARAQLSKLVDSAEHTHERFDITRNGRRAAVLLAAEDYDSMRETIEILSDPQAMAELREGEADIAEGRTSSLEAVIVGLRQSGRLVD